MKKMLAATELLLLGCISGLAALYVAAYSYSSDFFTSEELWASYFENGWIVFMNLLMPVLLVFLFWFIFPRRWFAYLISSLICIGGSIVNYYKISLRNNPLKLADVRVFRTAAQVAGNYNYEISNTIIIAVIAIAGITALCFIIETLLRKKTKIELKWFARAAGILISALLIYISVELLYFSPKMHDMTITNPEIEDWFDTDSYISRGFVYPFIKSGHHMNDSRPDDYSKNDALNLLSKYSDSDIPDDRKVNLIGIMLEAFTDFSDFEKLDAIDAVAEIYEPLHNLEEQSIQGNVVANVFGGNTEQTEWAAISGYSLFNEFRFNTNSFAQYLAAQGYTTHYAHPDYSWMYHRNDAMKYLGFDSSFFTENYFGEYVSADYAPFDSDSILVDFILKDIESAQEPLFLFATSYQNHGPYRTYLQGEEIIKAEDGLSEESRTILNNYLTKQKDTLSQIVRLTDSLKESDKPVVLFFFGDHKAWAGNNNSVYKEIGADFNYSTIEGLEQHFATPIVIWANDKAKEVLDAEFTGEIGSVSPCFIINKVFNACGYEGSAFTKLSDEIMKLAPVIHQNGVFISHGKITDALSEKDDAKYRQYLNAQYYYQMNFEY